MTDDPTKLFEQLLAEQRDQTQGASIEAAREKARLRNEIEQESRRAGAELSALVSILIDRNVPTAPLYRLASRKHPFGGAPSQSVSKYTKIDGRAWIVASWVTGEDYTCKPHSGAYDRGGDSVPRRRQQRWERLGTYLPRAQGSR